MIEIDVEIKPSPREIKKAMRGLEGDLKDWKVVWKKMLPVVRAEMERTVRSKGSNAGIDWPALKQATIRRASGKRSRAPLIRSGKLLRKITAKGAKRSLTKTQLVYGLPSGAKKYMFVQHYGSDSRNIPARPYVSVTPRIQRTAQILMQRHADRVLAAAARKFNG